MKTIATSSKPFYIDSSGGEGLIPDISYNYEIESIGNDKNLVYNIPVSNPAKTLPSNKMIESLWYYYKIDGSGTDITDISKGSSKLLPTPTIS